MRLPTSLKFRTFSLQVLPRESSLQSMVTTAEQRRSVFDVNCYKYEVHNAIPDNLVERDPAVLSWFSLSSFEPLRSARLWGAPPSLDATTAPQNVASRGASRSSVTENVAVLASRRGRHVTEGRHRGASRTLTGAGDRCPCQDDCHSTAVSHKRRALRRQLSNLTAAADARMSPRGSFRRRLCAAASRVWQGGTHPWPNVSGGGVCTFSAR